jgi:hypothetical protein
MSTEVGFNWEQTGDHRTFNMMLDGRMVGWITARPPYCDRGHWQFNSELPGLDRQDGFPRYFMDLDRAKIEAEEWTRWRMVGR